MNEEVIVEKLEQFLSNHQMMTFREVPFFSRRVDLVGYSDDIDYVVMIEAKLTDWQRAIEQAKSCLLAADEVFIALPDVYCHRVKISQLDAFGIGLLSVGSDIKVFHSPGGLNKKHHYHGRNFVKVLETIVEWEQRGKSNGN